MWAANSCIANIYAFEVKLAVNVKQHKLLGIGLRDSGMKQQRMIKQQF